MDTIVTLEIQGESIECNRTDLIAHSDYFKAMFEGNFSESGKKKIPLKGVDLEAMNTILKLLWDPEYPIEEKLVLSLLQAACMLLFLEIKEKCIHRIEEVLNAKNCLKIWLYTEQLDLKVHCKAKLIALMEFMSVKETDYFLEMNLDEILRYLGNVCLQCDNEIEVFKAMMRWCENSEETSKEDIVKLLNCLDFTKITENEIRDMISCKRIGEFPEIVDILMCICSIKNCDSRTFPESCVEKAKGLLKCRNRNTQGFPCVLVENSKATHKENSTDDVLIFHDQFGRKRKYDVLEKNNADSAIIYIDGRTYETKRFFEINAPFSSWEGLKMIGFKQFIFLIGGHMGRTYWKYDIIKEKWSERDFEFPYPRRHFKMCVCNDSLFVIGGMGLFRVIQDNMFWYDFKNEKWSGQHELPCSSRQIKCCEYNNRLFILNINNKCGYIFDTFTKKWSKIEIFDESNVLPSYSEKLSLFVYKNNVYIKEDKLFKLQLTDNRLFVEKQIDITTGTGDICKTELILCGNKVYTLNKQICEETQGVNLSVFEVDSMENGNVDVRVIVEDNEHFKIDPSLVLFSVCPAEMCRKDDLINDC